MPESRTPQTPSSSLAEQLMALGRDREAVEVATRDLRRDHTTTPGGPMDGVQQLDTLMPLLHELVDGISTDQLDGPTPCPKFSVAGVLEHMIGGASAFAPAFRGERPSTTTASPTGSLQDQWRAAMADLLDAVHSPGATERTVAAPFGDVPGAVFARFVAFDGLVHGWDLATATNQPYAPPDDVVREVDAFARQALSDGMRDGETFATAKFAPVDASDLERVVAFSGRTINEKEAMK